MTSMYFITMPFDKLKQTETLYDHFLEFWLTSSIVKWFDKNKAVIHFSHSY